MLATLHLYIRAWKLLSLKKCAMRMQLSPRSCQNMVSLVLDHMYTCLLVPGEWCLCLWTVVCLPSPCLSGYTAFSVASRTGRKSCCCCARGPWFSPVPVLRHPTLLAFVLHTPALSFFSDSFYDSSSLSLSLLSLSLFSLSLSFSFFPSLSLFPHMPSQVRYGEILSRLWPSPRSLPAPPSQTYCACQVPC